MSELMVGLAAQLLGTPIACLGIHEGDQFRPVAARGLSLLGGFPACSLCPVTERSRPVVIPDLRTARCRTDCSGATSRPRILALAGTPLRSRGGRILGHLCAIDTVSRPFTPGAVDALERLGRCLSLDLEVQEHAHALRPPDSDPDGWKADRIASLARRLRCLAVTRGLLEELLETIRLCLDADAATLESWTDGRGDSPRCIASAGLPQIPSHGGLERPPSVGARSGAPCTPTVMPWRTGGPGPDGPPVSMRRGGVTEGFAVRTGDRPGGLGLLAVGWRVARESRPSPDSFLVGAVRLLDAVLARGESWAGLESHLRDGDGRERDLAPYLTAAALDARGRIAWIGARFRSALGSDDAPREGRGLRTIIHGGPPPGFFDRLSPNDPMPIRRAEIPMRGPGGSTRWCDSTWIPPSTPDPVTGESHPGMLLQTDVTERRSLESLLRLAENAAAEAPGRTRTGVALLDADARILAMNETWQEVCECREGPCRLFVGETSTAGSATACGQGCTDHEDGCRAALQEVLRGQRNRFEAELRCEGTAGPRWFAIRAGHLGGEEHASAWLSKRDVTWRRQLEEALRQSEETKRALLDSASDGIVTFNEEDRIESLNQAAERLFGYARDEVRGKDVRILFPDLERPGFRLMELATPPSSGLRPREVFGKRKNGGLVPISVRVQEVSNGRPRQFTAVLRDLSDQKRAEEQITHLAYYDLLTSLPNRILFRDRLELAVAQAQRRRRRLALILLDIDRFRTLNDSLGHRAGDRFLCQVAKRISEVIGVGNTAARAGGDEFQILLAEVRGPEDVARAGEEILAALRRPIEIDGREVFATASLGATVFPDDGEEIDQLIRNAEAAMYRAKRMGGNTCALFTAGVERRSQERFQLEAELHRAVENRQFVVHFQPEVAIDSGKVIGAEALVRWRHPERGLLLPGKFIPVAEDNGLIVPIGLQVFESVCHELSNWQRTRSDRFRIAVNVSLRQLKQSGVVHRLRRVITEAGIDPAWLDLEITESVAMSMVRSSRAKLRALRDLGVRLSLDDFGRGYSSLSHLKELPIDTVKIDRSFVRNITRDRKDAAITRGIIAMAHSLSLRVVAEGVEEPEQLEFLRREGCDSYQGYYFSRPVPVRRLHAIIDAQGHERRTA